MMSSARWLRSYEKLFRGHLPENRDCSPCCASGFVWRPSGDIREGRRTCASYPVADPSTDKVVIWGAASLRNLPEGLRVELGQFRHWPVFPYRAATGW